MGADKTILSSCKVFSSHPRARGGRRIDGDGADVGIFAPPRAWGPKWRCGWTESGASGLKRIYRRREGQVLKLLNIIVLLKIAGRHPPSQKPASATTKAQNEADTLLDAEIKLGELIRQIKPKYNVIGSSDGTNKWDGSSRKQRTKTLPPTIDKKESHYLQSSSR